MNLKTQIDVINFLIKDSGLNQTKFAEKHGLHKGMLSKVINGKDRYSLNYLEIIATWCGYEIELNYLLKPIK